MSDMLKSLKKGAGIILVINKLSKTNQGDYYNLLVNA